MAPSTAIVIWSKLITQPHGIEGDIYISDPTFLIKYLNNTAAELKSYFYLMSSGVDQIENGRYFLTGDVGTIDKDSFLSLKVRSRELIKKGGEQVSPLEVEYPLKDQPWVLTPICFAIPSKLYYEEVGYALVLSSAAPKNVDQCEVIKVMRACLKEGKLAPINWPTKWVICDDSNLPKTKKNNYICIDLSNVLGLDPEEDSTSPKNTKGTKAKIYWEVFDGLHFIITCYVMFMHIGSVKSWGAFNNLRGFPCNIHFSITLGGYSLESPTKPTIKISSHTS